MEIYDFETFVNFFGFKSILSFFNELLIFYFIS